MYVWDLNYWSDILSLKKLGYLIFEVVRFEKNIIKIVLKKKGVFIIVNYGNI